MSLSSRYGRTGCGPETVLPWTSQRTTILAEEGYFGLPAGSMKGFTFASLLVLCHRVNAGGAMALAGLETALLDEVRGRYDGRVATVHDLDVF
jgi:hypothetical protein